MEKKVIATVLIFLLGAGSASAGVGSVSHIFQLELTSGCTVDTSGLVSDLGTYPVGSPNLLGLPLGNVTIICDDSVEYNWGVDVGNYDGQRWMAGTSTPFVYILRSLETGLELGDIGLECVDPWYVPTTWSGGQVAFMGCGYVTHLGGGIPVNHSLEADFILSSALPGVYSDTVNFIVTYK